MFVAFPFCYTIPCSLLLRWRWYPHLFHAGGSSIPSRYIILYYPVLCSILIHYTISYFTMSEPAYPSPHLFQHCTTLFFTRVQVTFHKFQEIGPGIPISCTLPYHTILYSCEDGGSIPISFTKVDVAYPHLTIKNTLYDPLLYKVGDCIFIISKRVFVALPSHYTIPSSLFKGGGGIPISFKKAVQASYLSISYYTILSYIT